MHQFQNQSFDRSRSVLIFGTQLHWLPAIFADGLKRQGMRVGAVVPTTAFIRATRLDYVAPFRCRSLLRSLRAAIAAFDPAQIVPCDDPAVDMLHSLQARLQKSGAAPEVAALLERSLGNSEFHSLAKNKSQLLQLAATLGIAAPETIRINSAEEAAVAASLLSLPAMIKADGTFGGQGVAKVSSAEEAADRLARMSSRPSLGQAVRDCVREGRIMPLARRAAYTRPRVTLQQRIDGAPCNRAVLCEQGRVLAGITVRVVTAMPANGPATVVEVIDHPQIAADVERLVAAMGLTGFMGFDFMLDRDQRAWLLELNPRVTPACCLFAPDTSHLLATFRAKFVGAPARAADAGIGQTIVLFPQELGRDRRSPLLASAGHHIPWHNLKLVQACLRELSYQSPYVRARAAFWRTMSRLNLERRKRQQTIEWTDRRAGRTGWAGDPLGVG